MKHSVEESITNLPSKKQTQNNNRKFAFLKKWNNIANIKIGLGILTALLLYVAELKYSENIDIKLSMKKWFLLILSQRSIYFIQLNLLDRVSQSIRFFSEYYAE